MAPDFFFFRCFSKESPLISLWDFNKGVIYSRSDIQEFMGFTPLRGIQWNLVFYTIRHNTFFGLICFSFFVPTDGL